MHSIKVLITVIVIAFFLFKFVSLKYRRRQNASRAHMLGCSKPPKRQNKSPWGLDVLRGISRSVKEKRLPQYLRSLLDEQGSGIHTIQINILGEETLLTRDPENIRAMHVRQFNEFILSQNRRKAFLPFCAKGIFSANGEYWAFSRKLLRPSFSRETISDLNLEEKHLANMLKTLLTDQSGWTEGQDMLPRFSDLTLDISTEFLYGSPVGAQSTGLDSSREYSSAPSGLTGKQFSDHWDTATTWITKRAILNIDLMMRPRSFMDACRAIHDYTDHFVAKALEISMKIAPSGSETKQTFLRNLVAQTQDPSELRYQTLSVLFAGRDSTAGFLGWFFILMAQNPEKLAKLRLAILEAFGTFNTPRNLDFASLSSSSYLQCCMKEVLRLYPIVSHNTREAAVDTTLPRGGGPDGKEPIFIAKGQLIRFSSHALHRREDLWGGDAKLFRPERFEDVIAPWHFIPFGGGPRVCIGQQFALTEAGYIVTRLLQKYDRFELLEAPGVEEIHDMKITDRPATVKMRFHEADE